MPSRILRDWTDSLALAELSPEAERFFVRLIMKADDYGRFHGDERLLKSALFPLLADVRLSAVRSWRDECAAARLLAPYQDERGRVFLEIVNFGQQRRAKSKFPEPASDAPASASNCDQPASNCALYSESDSESESDCGDGESTSALGEPKTDPPPPNPRKRADATPYDRIFALYAEHCPSLAQMRLRTPKRDAGARRLWGKALSWAKSKGGGEAEAWGFVSVLFDAAQASPFLRGEKPSKDHPNWKADFEFVTRDESMAKIMEGAYDR